MMVEIASVPKGKSSRVTVGGKKMIHSRINESVVTVVRRLQLSAS